MDELVATGDSNSAPDVALDEGQVYRLTIDTFVELPSWAADAIVGALAAAGFSASVVGTRVEVWIKT
jgi:hypothetical protein